MNIQEGRETGSIFEYIRMCVSLKPLRDLKEKKIKTKHLAIESTYLNFHSAKCCYSAVQPSDFEPGSLPNHLLLLAARPQSAGSLLLPKQLHTNLQREMSIRLLIS